MASVLYLGRALARRLSPRFHNGGSRPALRGWVATDMGGEQAPVQPAESAAGLVKVIAANGVPGELPFLDWRGERVAW